MSLSTGSPRQVRVHNSLLERGTSHLVIEAAPVARKAASKGRPCWPALLQLACLAFLPARSSAIRNVGRREPTTAMRRRRLGGAAQELCRAALANEEASCAMPKAACGCRYAPETIGASRYAVIISGGLRTFAAASFSLKQFLLDVNAPVDVFVFGVYMPGHAQGARNLEAVKEVATAYVVEPFAEVPEEDPNDADVPLRMLWQWEAIGRAFNMSVAYGKARGRGYDMFLRTRPDIVYFTPLSIDKYLASYREEGLYRPYFAKHRWQEIEPELEAAVPPPYLPSTAQPVFFPACDDMGGVTDRLWMADEEMMALMLKADFYERFRRMNRTAARELVPVGIDPDYDFVVGDGFEHILREWLVWNHVPLVEIPSEGPGAFAWATLRTNLIGNYCDGQLRQMGHWTDLDCAYGDGFEEREALDSPKAQAYCKAWKDGAYPPA